MAKLNLRNPNGYDGSLATQYKQGIVRFATAAEAAAGTMDDVAITPATAQASIALNFASPPVLGYGSTTPRPVAATTLTATSLTTNVATAQLSLSGNTIAATGSDAAVNLNLTTKGAGSIVYSQSKAGVDQNLQITNSDNTAAISNAGIQLAVGGSTNLGDPYLSFQISGVGASTMTMGLDNTDSDRFVISNSATLGTANALTLTQAGALGATTSITAGTTLSATLGDITATNGNLVLTAPGNKLVIAAAAPTTDSVGTTAAMIGGAVTITSSAITASSKIIYSRRTLGTAMGHVSITAQAGGSATLTSDAGTETSTFDYLIIN